MAIITGTTLLIIAGVTAAVSALGYGGTKTVEGAKHQTGEEAHAAVPLSRDKSIFNDPKAIASLSGDKELKDLSDNLTNASEADKMIINSKIKMRIATLSEDNLSFEQNILNAQQQQQIDKSQKKVAEMLQQKQNLLRSDIELIKSYSGYWNDNNEATAELLRQRLEKYGPEYMAALELQAHNDKAELHQGKELRDIINGNCWMGRNSYDGNIYQYLDKGAKLIPEVGALAMRGAMKDEGTYEEQLNMMLAWDPYFLKKVTEMFNSKELGISEGQSFAAWIADDTSGDYEAQLLGRVAEASVIEEKDEKELAKAA